MKKSLLILMTFVLAVSWIPTRSVAVSYIKFVGEIGRSKSGKGDFGPDLAIAFDDQSNIYVSDQKARAIKKLSPRGDLLMTISGYPISKPGDICVDGAGNIYVADIGAYLMDAKTSPPLYFFSPCALKYSPDGKLIAKVFVDQLDARPNAVLPARAIIDENGKYALAVQPEGYDRKIQLAVDRSGTLFVLDIDKCRIHKFNGSGELVTSFGRYGAGDGAMDDPADIAVSPNSEVFVADKGNHRVVAFSKEGNFLFSFGKKGLRKNEMMNPSYVTISVDGNVIVKDAAQWTRLIMNAEELLSVVIQNIVFEGSSSSDPVSRSEMLSSLLTENEDVAFTVIDSTEGKGETESGKADERLAQKADVYGVIERVQLFDRSGRSTREVVYRIDKRNPKLHDLQFAAVDRQGYIYLLDKSDHILRKYEIEGFSIKSENIDGVLSVRGQNREEKYVEDYEDLDEKPDLDDTRNMLDTYGDLFMKYDLSPRMSLIFRDILKYGEQDQQYITPSRLEDSYGTDMVGVDNFFGTSFRWILNPNPRTYRELNFGFQHVTGRADLGLDGLYQDYNKQKSEVEGESGSYLLSVDWDILRDLNLKLEYSKLNPDQTDKNYTKRYYDVSGDLYEVLKSRNSSTILSGEIRLRF